MLKRYWYRLHPTPGQQRAMVRAFGCARVVYNDTIAAREQAWESEHAGYRTRWCRGG